MVGRWARESFSLKNARALPLGSGSTRVKLSNPPSRSGLLDACGANGERWSKTETSDRTQPRRRATRAARSVSSFGREHARHVGVRCARRAYGYRPTTAWTKHVRRRGSRVSRSNRRSPPGDAATERRTRGKRSRAVRFTCKRHEWRAPRDPPAVAACAKSNSSGPFEFFVSRFLHGPPRAVYSLSFFSVARARYLRVRVSRTITADD